jgi:hypothetical protein
LGNGINPDGIREGWLVRLGAPIPEPSTWIMLLLAVAAMLTGRRTGASKLNSA